MKTDRSFSRLAYWLLLASILVLGARLRFDGLGEPSLWLDEILNVQITERAGAEQPWWAWIAGFQRENGPLYYATQRAALVLPDIELAARFAPALFGTLSLFLGEGWSRPAPGPDGRGSRWVLGRRARLALPLVEAPALRLRFTARPFSPPGAPPQVLAVSWNRHPVAEIEMAPGWSDYEVEIPAELTHPGLDTLTLDFAFAGRPVDFLPGSRDERELSAAFDFLALSSSLQSFNDPDGH